MLAQCGMRIAELEISVPNGMNVQELLDFVKGEYRIEISATLTGKSSESAACVSFYIIEDKGDPKVLERIEREIHAHIERLSSP